MHLQFLRAIEQLDELAELLNAEINDRAVEPQLARVQACNEALLAMRVLRSKLDAIVQIPPTHGRQLELGGGGYRFNS